MVYIRMILYLQHHIHHQTANIPHHCPRYSLSIDPFTASVTRLSSRIRVCFHWGFSNLLFCFLIFPNLARSSGVCFPSDSLLLACYTSVQCKLKQMQDFILIIAESYSIGQYNISYQSTDTPNFFIHSSTVGPLGHF